MALNIISIGKKIKTLRRRRGLSQMTLSEMVDCSPTYISYIENGYKSMSLETFVEIANALNATADELLAENLVNTIKVTNHEFAGLLSDCTEYERLVLFDILQAAKAALRERHHHIFTRK